MPTDGGRALDPARVLRPSSAPASPSVSSPTPSGSAPAGAVHASRRRHGSRPGRQGARARHRLRSQARAARRRPARLRPQCRPGLSKQLRRAARWPSSPTTDSGRAVRLRAKCLAGLRPPSARTRPRSAPGLGIELNRDDKAHRFVVTWIRVPRRQPARLLALTLAIGVDSWCSCRAVRRQRRASPLSDVPSPKARSAHQLEAIIEAHCCPTSSRMRASRWPPCVPSTNAMASTEVRLCELDPESAAQCSMCSTPARPSAPSPRRGARSHYLVRSELHNFLSDIVNQARPETTRARTMADASRSASARR